MDGNAFLKELTKQAPFIPVVVISATPQSLKPHRQIKAVIAKPFDIDQLLSGIKKVRQITKA